jgi:hypothetical protein
VAASRIGAMRMWNLSEKIRSFPLVLETYQIPVGNQSITGRI